MWRAILLLPIWALACSAQQWEIGVAGGYGLYRNATIFSPAGTATAGFRNRFAVGAVLGQDMYDRLAGEIRYTFQDGDPFVAAADVKTNLQGVSHAVEYALLFHLRPRRAKIRPYVAAGGGVKVYVVTGPENPFQPLSRIGVLAATDDLQPLVTAGAGVKLRVNRNLTFRFDFRDYITRFPEKLIVPAPFATGRGIFHQFTPLLGLSYVF